MRNKVRNQMSKNDNFLFKKKQPYSRMKEIS